MVKLEWADLWAAMKARADEWIETTERMYDEMLNVLPPRAMSGSGFLVGEPDHSNEFGESVYAAFSRTGDGRYFAAYRTVAQFRGVKR
jgi:hypothetical protein